VVSKPQIRFKGKAQADRESAVRRSRIETTSEYHRNVFSELENVELKMGKCPGRKGRGLLFGLDFF
jgi:hypothetical protein